MTKKQKGIIIAVVATVLTVVAAVGIYIGVHNNKDIKVVPNAPETTIDSWVEDYDFHQDEDVTLEGYEDRELPPITLKQ